MTSFLRVAPPRKKNPGSAPDCSTSKLNSTFGTIGKATADKKAAKVVGKLKVFTLAEEF